MDRASALCYKQCDQRPLLNYLDQVLNQYLPSLHLMLPAATQLNLYPPRQQNQDNPLRITLPTIFSIRSHQLNNILKQKLNE
jgi:hypothetical protein